MCHVIKLSVGRIFRDCETCSGKRPSRSFACAPLERIPHLRATSRKFQSFFFFFTKLGYRWKPTNQDKAKTSQNARSIASRPVTGRLSLHVIRPMSLQYSRPAILPVIAGRRQNKNSAVVRASLRSVRMSYHRTKFNSEPMFTVENKRRFMHSEFTETDLTGHAGCPKIKREPIGYRKLESATDPGTGRTRWTVDNRWPYRRDTAAVVKFENFETRDTSSVRLAAGFWRKEKRTYDAQTRHCYRVYNTCRGLVWIVRNTFIDVGCGEYFEQRRAQRLLYGRRQTENCGWTYIYIYTSRRNRALEYRGQHEM